ncbi:trypsin-like peptidase domain-containing protein [Rhizorhabdus argentea]|uniref:trypsin-like peptidase domain-containing protein n=1 Tax=Rhizorhabdus argentea TaxID=1387174 RepID=UPI0030EB67CB
MIDAGPTDERGVFLVEDPHLRASIMPLFAIDKRDLAMRPKGCGTLFRINPWGACVTAYHVIEDLIELKGSEPALREHARLIALELEGIAYGAPRIRPEQWRNFEGMFVLAGRKSTFGQPDTLTNVTELASLVVQRSQNVTGAAAFLGMDLRRWKPSVGEQVTALGFADLDLGNEDAAADRPISQYLYGSRATITDIEPFDPNRGRPWPFFRVDKDWPGGMSGGPVINAAGHVIGVVSTGMSFAAAGSAVFFAGNHHAEGMFRAVDPGAPGHIFCYGGFDAGGKVAMIAPTREAFEAMSGAAQLLDPGTMSFDPATGNYICV